MDWDAFFEVHKGLPREGPGLPEDVTWTLSQLSTPPKTILDAACGPGADTVNFAVYAPEARIHAVDTHARFVEEARARTAHFGPRVTCAAGDMYAQEGPYDLIWCAGAVYFVGVAEALTRWRPVLAEGGAVAFSHPVLPANPTQASLSFWTDYPEISEVGGVEEVVAKAGYEMRTARLIQGAAWEAYYTPMEARISGLRAAGCSPAVEVACQEAETEIAAWRAGVDEIAYLLMLVTPN